MGLAAKEQMVGSAWWTASGGMMDKVKKTHYCTMSDQMVNILTVKLDFRGNSTFGACCIPNVELLSQNNV